MRFGSLAAVIAVLSIAFALGTNGSPATASHGFDDVPDTNTFHSEISWLASEGITRGCNPPSNSLFCPGDRVTRQQFAAFMVRALGLTEVDPEIDFVDVPLTNTFASDITKLATAGITKGCNPPTNDRFCPKDVVTREQFAAFFVRALAISENDDIAFTDVAQGGTFASDISKLATTGITRGCNPPTNDRFCPREALTRQTLAAFFHRGFVDYPAPGGPSPSIAKVEAALAFAATQLRDTVNELPNTTLFPRSAAGTTWTTKGATDWTSGFFPSLLWRMYLHTGDADLKTAAIAWSTSIASQATRTDTHDLGFMVGTPAQLAYEATNDPSYRATVLTAAASLATRFNSDVGAIRSWDFGGWAFPVIVDNMMNLELLLQGADETTVPGDAAAWRAMAGSHADTTAAEHVRGDGSTYHVVDFDPDTGAVNGRGTHAGTGDESTWARGQAWGIYGFTMMHRRVGDQAALTTAQILADYFIANLPPDKVPYWDFDAPDIPAAPRDSSAAAIAASGLLELSTLSTGVDADRYLTAATAILETLLSGAYLSDGDESPGLLLHGTGNFPASSEIDVSLIYADYYLVEALIRYLDIVGS